MVSKKSFWLFAIESERTNMSLNQWFVNDESGRHSVQLYKPYTNYLKTKFSLYISGLIQLEFVIYL